MIGQLRQLHNAEYDHATELTVLNVLSTGQRRGAETFAYELHRTLIRRGVASRAVCLVPGGSSPELPLPTLGKRRYAPSVLWATRRMAARSSIVIGHGSSTLMACTLALIGLRVPFVYVNIGDPRHWAPSPGRRLRVQTLLARASAVAAISPRSRDVLVAEFGLRPECVRVIPNGRSSRAFAPASADQRAAARARLGVIDAPAVLAMVGALTAEKQVDVAVRALAWLPEATLIVAGDGPERSALVALAGAVAPGRVRFLGRVSSATDVLAAADVVVLSSNSEGVPGALIEAGLAGVPAVATNVGFVGDVVVQGETGELVPPGEPRAFASAAERVLRRREEYGAGARAHCLAHFELDHVVDRWQDLITDLCVSHRADDR